MFSQQRFYYTQCHHSTSQSIIPLDYLIITGQHFTVAATLLRIVTTADGKTVGGRVSRLNFTRQKLH